MKEKFNLFKALFCEYSIWSYSVGLILVVIIFNFLISKDMIINFVTNFMKIDILKFGDIIYLLTMELTNVYCWALPLSLTFYYFIAREQKSLSESSLNLDKKGLRHFFLTLLLLILNGYILDVFYKIFLKEYKLYNSNFIENNIYLITYFWVGTTIFIIFSCKAMLFLFQSININSLSERILYKAKTSMDVLNLKSNKCKFLRKQIYSNLIYSVESIYQMLIQSVNKGLTSVYTQKYMDWKSIVNSIFTTGKNRKDIELLSKNISEYPNFYKSILRNQVILITILYSCNRIDEGRAALRDLFDLVPDGDITSKDDEYKLAEEYNKLTIEYLTVLCGLGLFFYKNDIVIYPLITQIKSLSIQRVGIDNIIEIYRTWIIKIVESNDVKMLVCLSYSMIDTIEEVRKKSDASGIDVFSNTQNGTLTTFKKEEMQQLIFKAVNKYMSNAEEDKKNIGKCIYILLNSAIKSLETSQYACVGFIIKFIVSNFPSDITNKAFEQFVINKGRDSKFDNHEIGIKFGLSSFNLNNKTDDYCLKKLTFLLFGQQVYVKENEVLIKNIPNTYITIGKEICPTIKYIYEKIRQAKDKYGLIWLMDDKFSNKIKNKIILKSKLINQQTNN